MSIHFTPAHPFAGVIAREILRRERENRPAVITLAPSQYRDVTPGTDDDPTPPAAPAALPARLAA